MKTILLARMFLLPLRACTLKWTKVSGKVTTGVVSCFRFS